MKVLQHIYQHPLFTDSDIELLFAAHEKVSFKKGEFLLEKGQVANSYCCVESGLIRSYVYNYKGDDITTDFIGKNQVVIDVVSLFKALPAEEEYQALTDCQCYRISLEKFQVFYHSSKGLNEWGRAWMSDTLFRLKQRTVSMITQSAAQRYLALQKEHPEILQQSPLKYIASYLGITDTSLSRIRKEIAKE